MGGVGAMSASTVVITDPILNVPFAEPTRHFHFTDEGITNEVVQGRRTSSYLVPIAQPKMKGKLQLALPHEEWTKNRRQENVFINRVRERVALWRRGGYQGVTKTTARLLAYWQQPERERRLFFCQLEALETIIYSPKSPRSSAMANCWPSWSGRMPGRIRSSFGWPARWRPAAARPW